MRGPIANLSAICGGLLAVLAAPAQADWHSDSQAIMGTDIRVQLWQDDADEGRAAVTAVMSEMRRIDALMSTHKTDTELARVNRQGATEAVTVSRELFELIEQSLEFSALTDGAFDITYAGVGRLYDYRVEKRPDTEQRQQALAAVGWQHVLLDAAACSVRFARPGVRIDLGGIAKGYAVESAVELLRLRGVEHALVSAGGDSRILGDRRGRPWLVGIRDPRDRNAMATRIPLYDEAISTSGDYERYFEAEGKRYHHIIRPTTGTSPTGLRSVSIIGANATVTDALSTSVFVLGREKGLQLIESMPDFEAVMIDADGVMHYSSGLIAGNNE